MKIKSAKSSWLSKLRGSQRQVEDIGSQAEANIEKLLFKRYERLWPIRRFVFGWLGLIVILIVLVIVQNFSLSNYFQTLKFVPGGIYTEGLQGNFTNANPIYSVSEADNTVSKLIFAGLLKYDDNGQLVGNLAKSYSVGGRGNVYTVNLRPHIFWQDGQPLTAKDVVFTFQTIENPDTQSPLFTNWKGVQVSALNNSTVQFTLPGVLASFPTNLTTGIIPEHLLGKIPPSELRSASFNTIRPIGAGPFEWSDISVKNGNNSSEEEVQLGLTPFNKFVNGAPKLDKFFIHIYADQKMMYSDFNGRQLTGMETTDQPPSSINKAAGVIDHSFILRAGTYVFFKTSSGLLADTNVRQALVQGADQSRIIAGLGYQTLPVNEPLLIGQLGYSPKYAQASFNEKAAEAKLINDGWGSTKNGTRYKANSPLSFSLIAANTSENKSVINELKKDWVRLGVGLNVQLENPLDFQQALSYHVYDAILTSITIGSDPDVFVYWDSSQADIRSASRLNLSEYKNASVDNSVESGRTRLDPTERVIKYQPFLAQWQQDAPALGLYQPRLLYLTNGPVGGMPTRALNSSIDRFDNAQNIEVREAKVTD